MASRTVPRLADRYRLGRPVWRGPLAIRYQATELRSGNGVVVDLLVRELVGTEAAQTRLIRRLRAVSRLDHPGIVPVLEWSAFHRPPYVVRRRPQGRELSALMAGGPLPPARIRALLGPLADAIAYAHEAGVVHYDLRPEIVTVDTAGRARITDFPPTPLPEAEPSPYRAPEQLAARRVTRACDVYSLGCLLFELASGERPFTDEEDAQRARTYADPPLLSDVVPEMALADPGLVYLCDDLLARRPADRPTAEDAADELQTAPTPLEAWQAAPALAPAAPAPAPARPKTARRRRPWILAGAALAAAVAVLALAWPGSGGGLPRGRQGAPATEPAQPATLVSLPSGSCGLDVPRGWTVAWADLNRGVTWHNEVQAPGGATVLSCDVSQQYGRTDPRRKALEARRTLAAAPGYRQLQFGSTRIAGRQAFVWRYRMRQGPGLVDVRYAFFPDGVDLRAQAPAQAARRVEPTLNAAFASYRGRLVAPGHDPDTAAAAARASTPSSTATVQEASAGR